MTSPIEFGDEICPDGPFDTCGWGCATNPMQDELIDEETFLADIEEIERQRRDLLAQTLLVPDWRLFFCVLSTPDRVQHMFWRDRDPLHPRARSGGRRRGAATRSASATGGWTPSSDASGGKWRSPTTSSSSSPTTASRRSGSR